MHHTKQFFRFDKDLVKRWQWACVDKAGKAVYPVLASHANKRGDCWPHLKTIAKQCGRSRRTAIRGIRDLQLHGLIKVKKKNIKNGCKANQYHISIPPKEHDKWFPFRNNLIRRVWGSLTSNEQAIYVVMRTFSRIDPMEYCCFLEDERDQYAEIHNFDEWYPFREWECCSVNNKTLSDYSGVALWRIPETLKKLKDNFLIEPDPEWRWRVYLEENLPF